MQDVDGLGQLLGIEYGYQPGGNGRSKRGQFNPDFFLLRENDEVIVVETKAHDDFTDVNRGKLAYATAYFEKLNELLKAKRDKRRYHFYFISPVDYSDFFADLRDGKLKGFVTTLQAGLNSLFRPAIRGSSGIRPHVGYSQGKPRTRHEALGRG